MKKYNNYKTKSKTCKKLSTLSTNPPIIPPLYIYYINIYKGGYYKYINTIKKCITLLGKPRLGFPNTHSLIELKIINRELHARDTKKLKTRARIKIIICPTDKSLCACLKAYLPFGRSAKKKRRKYDMH